MPLTASCCDSLIFSLSLSKVISNSIHAKSQMLKSISAKIPRNLSDKNVNIPEGKHLAEV